MSRKNHYFYITPEKYEECSYEDTGLNLARCVSMNTNALTTKSSIEFSKINELDLVVDNLKYNSTIISKLSSMIRLTQLTQICFSQNPVHLGLLLEILHYTINIQTLIFHNTKIFGSRSLTFEQTQIFHSLIKKNSIEKLVLDLQCTFRSYKFLLHLCPRLKYLKMKLPKKFETILRYLFIENNLRNSQRSLICLWNIDKILFKQIQTFIDREKLLDDYSLEILGKELYLWW
jgi:hypothetical protein